MAKSIEEILEELETIITTMDQGEITLEEAFTNYETGMKLVKECSKKIDKVEKKILVLQEGGDNDG